MSGVNIVLWVAGIALMAIGYMRFRGPWSRYQGLREQQANIDRYEAWRGGVRVQDDGPTGASVAIAMARRQAQVAGLIIGTGIVLVALGFAIR
ncbi:MAG TPA: hypothetical protein VFM38_05550 [Candidatus Limnocylindrales bacterium]|jgi:hypothetical protein|nr:hypothetical protein [Candidatus Limnocylindrales bacterium]